MPSSHGELVPRVSGKMVLGDLLAEERESPAVDAAGIGRGRPIAGVEQQDKPGPTQRTTHILICARIALEDQRKGTEGSVHPNCNRWQLCDSLHVASFRSYYRSPG
ncbi:MAG TPA: hypothetical protein VFO40_10140 [Chthoniobacterales bacterium]|nr:hypothetical protein [Chthoniobacterales bacterium]